jgi:hypothetical protein
MSDNFTPKMDRAFALETIDAYPEDQPPTSSSDRFWFELAARFLAKDFITLERELAEARGELFDTEARYSPQKTYADRPKPPSPPCGSSGARRASISVSKRPTTASVR